MIVGGNNLLSLVDNQSDQLNVFRGTVDKPAIVQAFSPTTGEISSVLLTPEQIAQLIAALAGTIA